MKNIIQSISLVFLMTALTIGAAHAEMSKGDAVGGARKPQKGAADCVPATGSSQLNVNNVRAYITTAGSMWFNNSVAQYFIPKEGEASSMFAAALWIGGMDKAQQLKVAAIQFRQDGNDFWPGPLTRDTASVNQATCAYYDKIYVMTKAMAKKHMESYNDAGAKIDPNYNPPPEILNWPARPVNLKGQSQFLAPFFDRNGNLEYDPEEGDYPYYDFDNRLCPWTDENRAKAALGTLDPTMESTLGISKGGIMADQVLKGDQTLWWVFNDKGAPHTESKGEPIGLEIRAQAFGFATTDELNNMTFYSYEIINRSTQELTETFFSQWVDADLGFAQDDYIGCDVERGLGYCYNGKTPDGTGLIQHYGENPPAVGVDFFQGPYLDPDGEDNPSYKGDNKYGPSFIKNYPANNGCEIVPAHGTIREFTWDSVAKTKAGEDTLISVTRYVTVKAEAINGVNFGDGIVDNERYGMRRFVYHNNDRNDAIKGDPKEAIEYYNFLRGIWKNNVRMTFGGNGFNVGSTTYCDFMFPGDTDPCDWGTNGIPARDNYVDPKGGWTEEAEKNPYGDRRFMQSAGPFTLKAGSINYITVGIPWARAVGAPWASVQLLKIVDDKAQSLFENCFKVLDGPDAPDLVFREMDGKAICYLVNSSSSSNYKEQYEEEDVTIPRLRVKVSIETSIDTVYRYVCDTLFGQKIDGGDSLSCRYDTAIYHIANEKFDTVWYKNDDKKINCRKYRFEGYQIYQLADNTVKAGELSDPTKALLVFQCDIKNDVKEIKNYVYNAIVATEVPTLMVDGANGGIIHSFEVKKDEFATGGGVGLTNYKKYYYMAIAYAYNDFGLEAEGKKGKYGTSADNPDALFGQKNPYLPGNKNVRVYTVMPHKTLIEEDGTIVQSVYGTQPQITQYEGQGNGGNQVQLTKKTIDEILANGRADSLIFEKNAAPVNVRVIDPLKVMGKDYTLRFCDKKKSAESGDVVLHTIDNKETRESFVMVMANAVTDNTYWVLEYKTDEGKDTVICSDTCIRSTNEQLLLDLGISIFIKDAKFTPLDDNIRTENENTTGYYLLSSVDFLGSSISYQKQGGAWYVGIADMEGTTSSNWIRAGQTKDGDWALHPETPHTWAQKRKEDFYLPVRSVDPIIFKDVSKGAHTLFLDKGKQFEKILGGIFAPYALTSYYDGNPAYKYEVYEDASTEPDAAPDNPFKITFPVMTELYSVDIVLTADTMLWTRCPVVEMGNDKVFTVGGAARHDLRKSPSIYRNGQPDNSGTTGMGWFPGYAICVETGERLNMMFAENSRFGAENGANMLFDPTYGYYGQHHLYVLGHRDLYRSNDFIDRYGGCSVRDIPDNYICPIYDEGKWLYNKFKEMETASNRTILKNYIYKNVMWTGISLAYPQEKGNDVTIKIRVSRPYSRWTSTTSASGRTGTGAVNPTNNNMPLYKFSTSDIETKRLRKEVVQSHMDSIYITPNPYYGISTGGYESSQVDTRVKFVNLPKSCKIKVFTLNGTLIRQFDFNSPDIPAKVDPKNISNFNAITYLEWDLKNSANIPIASGMYLIHITDNHNGFEKTLKFMCIQRPIDVNAF